MKKISLILFVVFMCCKNETKDAVTIEEANTVLTENLEEENKYKIELNGVFTTNSTLVLNYLSNNSNYSRS